MINIDKLVQIVSAAGEIILSAHVQKDDIEAKEGHQNFVTIFDQRVQDYLEEQFQAEWPDYIFFGEENDRQEGDPETAKAFIVDPIDGTSNFISNLPFVAVSVGVAVGGEIVQAVVYNPYLKEMYTAEKGKGAWLNGEKITNPDRELKNGLFGYGMSPYNAAYIRTTLEKLAMLMPHVTDLRRLGAAALDICAVATGRQVGFFECELQAWDFAAASLIAEEAGCVVTTLEGKPMPLAKASSILVGGPKAYEKTFEIFAQ